MTSRFIFRKSWGAEPTEHGWKFRIWAPAAPRIGLRLRDADLSMDRTREGWFETEVAWAKSGDPYAFLLPDGKQVNDPAARAQLSDVHGPSRLVDPRDFEWKEDGWTGRPLEEVVLYELHVGTFSPEGTFDGLRYRLDYLAEVGVTAIELMPVAHFAGNRGWGYDGVLFYAPHAAYGGPEGLKRLIDEAHRRELMVFLDVVYNHFGPSGNYLSLYAPDFFHPEKHTPWGGAIAYEKKPVRDFFIENALFWLDEYRFDGLRLDAVDRIDDQSDEPILQEIALAVRKRIEGRHIHLMTEDDRNVVGLHGRDAEGRPILYSSEWNDDFHHAAHNIVTAETIGYYVDYGEKPVEQLARALASGYIYQGDPSPYRDGALRGESSAHLPPTAFVNFIQNHDQIGNRAYSERLTELGKPEIVEALLAILLLSPQIPLLFMGEEFGETRPFRFFTDFEGELAKAVREGRRREFAKWPHFASEEHSSLIPDPNAVSTFEDSALDWEKLGDATGRSRLTFVGELLAIRRREIMPIARHIGGNAGSYQLLGEHAFGITWNASDETSLSLYANLGGEAVSLGDAGTVQTDAARLIFAHGGDAESAFRSRSLPPRAVISLVAEADGFVPLPI